jgi:glucose-6-phosphate 1-dehydrogenase
MTKTDLIILGSTGDLAKKKLFPSLFKLFKEHVLPDDFKILAVTRTLMAKEALRESVISHCVESAEDRVLFDSFLAIVVLVAVEINEESAFAVLNTVMRSDATRIFYFAISPALYGKTAHALKSNGCINPSSRVVVEKPLGADLASAQAINAELTANFHETQIFRIDHYLGKETVQNIMALRFGNAIFEPLWNGDRIEYIQITAAEQVGVFDRGEFYDRTGALRDMVQNHLLQLLCIVAMEPPAQLNPVAVRNEKLKVLYSLRPIEGESVVKKTIRGQYSAFGLPYDATRCSYIDEAGVSPDSTTETFVALKVELDNWRWAGMPVYLRTGKALKNRYSEIVIQFKDVPHLLFKNASSGLFANRLVIRLQPEESIRFFINAKSPGRGMTLEPMALNLDLTTSHKKRRWQAYERLLMDIIQGDLTLFMREKDIEAAWSWIDPIIRGWHQHMPNPEPYLMGSWGPVSADQLLALDGFIWHNPFP